MAEKGQTIIIKKKKGGGHGGAHGGAWKVAYADFVTAMMCFFLVMWLMGSDEETKAAVAHYFNHPNTPWKAGQDPNSKETHAMGESEGSGESIMNGLMGLYPEDLIQRPAPQKRLKENRKLGLMVEDVTEGKAYGLDIDPDHVKFSLPDSVLFDPASAELSLDSKKTLDQLGALLKNFSGFITIEGHTDDTPVKGKYHSNWELSMARALSVMNYLIEKHQIPEKKIIPIGSGPRRALASNTDDANKKKNRRVEFILTYEKPL